jgi:hypothetical protein
MQYIDIHSFGKCLNNRKLENSSYGKFESKVESIGHYKFYLAFENSNLSDYVTEKLLHGFQATTLPIYMGAPNIDEFLPHLKSIIKTDNFQNPKDLAEYLHKLLKNEEEYNSYFSWKKIPSDQLSIPKSMKPRTCKYCNYNWQCRTCLRIHGLL